MKKFPESENDLYLNEVEWSDVQGLLRSGYASYTRSQLIRISFNKDTKAEDCRQWLRPYVTQVSNAIKKSDPAAREERLLNIAVSARGLLRLGIPQSTLDTFPMEFVDGISSERGAHIFRDGPDGPSQDWEWGLGENIADIVFLAYFNGSSEQEEGKPETGESFVAQLRESIENIGSIENKATYLQDHEHFGFRDGLSNPVIRGSRSTIRENQIEPGGLIAPGEFIFGYADGRGVLAISPQLDAVADPINSLPAALAFQECGPNQSESLQKDFGRNGSFLAVMQLHQDTAGFEQYVKNQSRTRKQNPEKVYAQMMGRWKNGTPITSSPDEAVDNLSSQESRYANNFAYADSDANGDRCPLGSHIRRSNPRDTLHKDKHKSWKFANRHRIIRRGRLYGGAEAADKGLMFMCLNISLARQFEHIQRNWINNERFAVPAETDPIVGSRFYSSKEFTKSTLSPDDKLKGLPGFVTPFGGGYFFLPGIKALNVIIN